MAQGVHRASDTVVELVEWLRALPYGRPAERTVAGMLAEGRGTCSTKHRFLAEALLRNHPELRPRIVHRCYRLQRRDAARTFGPTVAAAVPEEGLNDVHRYVTIELNKRQVAIDATLPGPPWDGVASMPLACGPGEDEVCVGDPDERKRELERRHCDPEVRERFIAALADSRIVID